MGAYDDNQQSDPISEARRRFLKISIGALTFMSSIVLGLPFIRTIYRSAPVTQANWSKVTELDSIPLNRPINIKFPTQSEDAFIQGTKVQAVWIIKRSGQDVTVYSPICTHLGCYFAWNDKSQRFECPCHASVFSIDGRVLGGPAPRPLDVLQHRIEDNTLFIKWEQFKSGITEKVQV